MVLKLRREIYSIDEHLPQKKEGLNIPLDVICHIRIQIVNGGIHDDIDLILTPTQLSSQKILERTELADTLTYKTGTGELVQKLK